MRRKRLGKGARDNEMIESETDFVLWQEMVNGAVLISASTVSECMALCSTLSSLEASLKPLSRAHFAPDDGQGSVQCHFSLSPSP